MCEACSPRPGPKGPSARLRGMETLVDGRQQLPRSEPLQKCLCAGVMRLLSEKSITQLGCREG